MTRRASARRCGSPTGASPRRSTPTARWCLTTRPKNPELLRAIVQHEPVSIPATARLVHRDVRQVHRNPEELAELRLVAFEGGGPGPAKGPTVRFDAIEIDVPLREPVVDGAP